MVEQGVDQGAIGVSGSGMDHQPHRLIHHNHVVILVYHVQRDILRHDLHRLRVGKQHLHHHAGGGLGVLFQRLSPAGHHPLFQQALGGGAGQVLHLAGHKGVQPLAPLLGGQNEGGHRLFSRDLGPSSLSHSSR